MAVAGNVNTTVINSGSITGWSCDAGPSFWPDLQSRKTCSHQSEGNAIASPSEPRSGRGGRRFESCHSDHHLAKILTRYANGCAKASRDEVRTEPGKAQRGMAVKATG